MELTNKHFVDIMANKYPWYEIVEGKELEQGDLIRTCPVIVPVAEAVPTKAGENIMADILTFDVVIMTQSCDLVNEKTQEIILCPHWDLKNAEQMDAFLSKKDTQRSILKGRIHRYTMLAASDDAAIPMGIRVVDFGRIFTLPRSFVHAFASRQGKRLRLLPPYREHLSQAFARFFMRVGLPQDIELPD